MAKLGERTRLLELEIRLKSKLAALNMFKEKIEKLTGEIENITIEIKSCNVKVDKEVINPTDDVI